MLKQPGKGLLKKWQQRHLTVSDRKMVYREQPGKPAKGEVSLREAKVENLNSTFLFKKQTYSLFSVTAKDQGSVLGGYFVLFDMTFE